MVKENRRRICRGVVKKKKDWRKEKGREKKKKRKEGSKNFDKGILRRMGSWRGKN